MKATNCFPRKIDVTLWLILCLSGIPETGMAKNVENVPVDTDWRPLPPLETREGDRTTRVARRFDDASLRKFVGDLQCDSSAVYGSLTSAQNRVERLLGDEFDNPNVWLANAEEKLRNAELNCNCSPDSGIQAALKAEAMIPDSPAPYLTAAKIHLFEGGSGQAKRDVEEAVKRGARDEDVAYVRALIARNQHDYKTEIQLLAPVAGAIEQSALRATAYESLGNAYRAMNQSSDAEKMYRMGASVDACVASPQQSLALFLIFGKSDSDGAKIILMDLMKRLPSSKTKRLISVADYYRLAGGRVMSGQQRAGMKELAQSAYVSPEEVFVESAKFDFGQYLLQNLIAAGTVRDVDAKDGENNTALISAAMGNNLPAARYLLGKHAKVDAENSSGQRALGFFSAAGNINAVKLLLDRQANADYVDRNGESPLKAATRGGYVDVARILLQSKKSFNVVNISALLSQAALQGNTELVELFLSAHANINESGNGSIPPLIGAILSRNRATIRLFLDKKADLRVRFAGKSVIEYARETGDDEIVKMVVRLSI